MEKKTNLNWEWSEGLKPSNRTFEEVIASARESVIKANGRLYTTEEAIQLVEEARKEFREKGEIE